MIGTFSESCQVYQVHQSHNRLSAFGVIGTDDAIKVFRENVKKSQSPFGFWGDWNMKHEINGIPIYFGHNRLSAFGVIGT